MVKQPTRLPKPIPMCQVNIFACDEWAVYSSRKVDVVPRFLQSAVVDSDLKCDMGGEFGTSEKDVQNRSPKVLKG